MLARLAAPWRGARCAPAAAQLPAWAQVGKRRRAHIGRGVALLEGGGEEMAVSQRGRGRWLRAAWVDDALRDARRGGGAAHGAGAADRAASYGGSDAAGID